jgi:hypothetical protein
MNPFGRREHTLEEGQLRTLARSTFSGFFESELMQPGLPQVRLVIFAIVVLMFPATQVPLRAGVAYDAASRRVPEMLDLLMWPHKLLFITLAMVGTAVVSLVIWDNVFPDRREAFVLGHLPIRTRTIVAARLSALAAVMGLVALGSAAPSALLYGVVAGSYSTGGIVRTVMAHFVATMGASVFAFLLLLCLQGVLINLTPGRWLQRAMILLQFVFVVASLEALLFMYPIIDGLEKAMAPSATVQTNWMLWMPPAWFLGLYEVIAGTNRPVARFALPAVAGLGLLVPIAFGLYAFTYQRLTRRAVEARDAERVGGGVGREPLVARAARHLTRARISDAVCRYAILTLLRSRKHRLLFTIFAGVGTTAAAMSVLVPLSRGRLASMSSPDAILPIGLVLVFFLVVGLRTLFAIPAEPSANWMFRLSDAEDARLHVRGAVAALVGGGVLPVIVLLAPIHLFTLGVAATGLHSVLLLAAGFLLAEIALSGCRRVPFTSAYAAPAARARVMWPFWLVGFLLFCFTLSTLERDLMRHPSGAVTLVAAIAAAAFGVRLVREWEFRLATRMLTFDGGEDDAPVTLELDGVVPIPAPPRPT